MNERFLTRPGGYAPDKAGGVSTLGAVQRFLDWYHVLVLGLAFGIIYANLPIYGYVLTPSLLPKYQFFALFVLMAPLVLVKRHAVGAYLSSPFVLWAAVFLIINLIHAWGFSAAGELGGASLVNDQLEARRSLILTRTQYVVVAILLGFVVFTCARNTYQYVTTFLAVLLPIAVILDFARPGLLYPLETSGAVLGRAAAMFINPTMAGEALLLVFLLSCAVTKHRYRGLLFLLAGAAIVATFSRSSIIAWVLLLPLLVFRRTLPRSTLVATAVFLGMFVVSLGSFEKYIDSRQEFEAASSNILSRLDFFSSFEFKDDSSEERASVIKAGWELFLQNPVFGAGAGATQFWSHRASTHNQLLLLAAEYGAFGIGLWVWLLVALWNGTFFQDRALQLAVVFLFAFMSMFTHLMLDSATYWLATFALASVQGAGAAPGLNRRKRRQDWRGGQSK